MTGSDPCTDKEREVNAIYFGRLPTILAPGEPTALAAGCEQPRRAWNLKRAEQFDHVTTQHLTVPARHGTWMEQSWHPASRLRELPGANNHDALGD